MWVFWILVTWYMIGAAFSHYSHVSRSVFYRWIALVNYYSSKWSKAVAAAAASNSKCWIDEQIYFLFGIPCRQLIGTGWNVAKDIKQDERVEFHLRGACSCYTQYGGSGNHWESEPSPVCFLEAFCEWKLLALILYFSVPEMAMACFIGYSLRNYRLLFQCAVHSLRK